MIDFAQIHESFTLEGYTGVAHLAGAVRELQSESSILMPQLANRTIWMVNSTAQGGGVAEMLPKMVKLLRELGLRIQWVTIGTDRAEFFALTKRLHNMIHGEGEPSLGGGDQELFDSVNRQAAEALKPHLSPEDIVVIHDPQPIAMGPYLKRELGVRTVWRCHIGLDEEVPATRAVWQFLKPYALTYDRAVFTAPEYIPDYLAGYSTIMHPALDPESHKNRELSPHELVGILCNAGLARPRHPILTPPFEHQAKRLQPDGTFAAAATEFEEIGLMYRSIVTQISRWDRLKGFGPLLEGFVRLKERRSPGLDWSESQRREVETARLVLAGPDPSSIQDDPEGQEVLQELCVTYRNLRPEYQKDVALLALPMASRKENALMVNALQRCSTIVVQNSIREGFGLTVTEAMWKHVAIIGTQACGLRQQIRDNIDGMLIRDPQDPDEITEKLEKLLTDRRTREILARSAQRRAHDEFLIFTQVRDWLRLLVNCANAPPKALLADGRS